MIDKLYVMPDDRFKLGTCKCNFESSCSTRQNLFSVPYQRASYQAVCETVNELKEILSSMVRVFTLNQD